ncbi:hypothetical protein Sta7437_3660 [Stanieria cyanosphaera PCC 7437]|uniref:Uncharacterized protein n=1 Tax=Stanieria cyanosphaera (strain ATCC 29371 / PCC 7437) TaxID=111780 RepID=K9XXB1_STAC7|nr:WGxxGxxG family protein [Stanieria cyanosphaera]AFZ37158.1 hypothetical protein Sta7437_3660 [Stanieria cyanosphaera PCC 7437]
MKNIKLSKLLAASAIATSLAVVPMVSVQAQTQVPPTQEGYVQEDNNFDWGWLGLLGLIGLAGLAGKNKRHNNTVYNDPTRTTTTDYR